MFNKIAEIKVYFGRSSAYISILNFLMILANLKISYSLKISVFIIIPVGFLFSILIGYLDYKLLMKKEAIHNNKKNDLKEDLKSLNIKVDKMMESFKNVTKGKGK